MGYYNEHPTMVGGLICESSFFGLRTLPADFTFRDRQLFFDSQLKACFDEVDRARLQLALQQFAKENNSSPGDI